MGAAVCIEKGSSSHCPSESPLEKLSGRGPRRVYERHAPPVRSVRLQQQGVRPNRLSLVRLAANPITNPNKRSDRLKWAGAPIAFLAHIAVRSYKLPFVQRARVARVGD